MSVELVYKLNGELDAGISVEELSPFLLSFAKLVNDARMALQPESEAISVSVRPFEKGSFPIDLIIACTDGLHAFGEFLSGDQGTMAALTYLGFIQSTSGINLMELIRYLKGQRYKSSTRLDSGEVRYEANDGSSIVVPEKVDTLYNNCTIQNNIYPVFGKPFEFGAGVKSTESYVRGEEQSTRMVYDDAVVEPTRTYSSMDDVTGLDEMQNESSRRVWVHPRRVSLEGERSHWSFRVDKNSGGTTFSASVKDKDFLDDVKRGAIRLSNADLLLVELREMQNTKVLETITKYEVTKVVRYRPAPPQGSLVF